MRNAAWKLVRIIFSLAVSGGWLGMGRAEAGDWPQILGPRRNGIAVEESIAAAWPEGGPRLRWQRPAGRGFAGVAVAEGAVVLYHRLGDRQIVEAFDPPTGRPRWRAEFPARYEPSYSDDDGPRVVPLVDRDRVYVYSAGGELRCLELASGKVVWFRDCFQEFNSKKPFHGEPPQGYFGVGTSPIVAGDKLLVNVGGDRQGAGIVAFALADGRTLWKATDQRAGYSSPVAVTVDGVRHVIFVTRLAVVSVDPQTGTERFRFPFGRIGPTVNAASPVVVRGHVFVTASYGIGAMLVWIGPGGAEVVWRDRQLLASQYTTCVAYQDCLFGIDGRQDGRAADLKCFNPITRRVLWTERGFGYATLIRAGDKLLILKTDGTLVLAAADCRGYRELARARVADSTTRALPALAEGLLYVRDRRTLKCLEVSRVGHDPGRSVSRVGQ